MEVTQNGVEKLAADRTGGSFFCILGRGVWGGGKKSGREFKTYKEKGDKKRGKVKNGKKRGKRIKKGIKKEK